MSRLVLATSLLLAVFSGNCFAAAPSPFGSYTGLLHHKNVPQDQLARLDFVTDQESNGTLKIRAFLVLYFGDFDSSEYTSYDYDNVSYNLLTGTLVFDSTERELGFVVNKFGDGKLEAVLKNVSGDVGTLSLVQGNTATPTRPLLQPITGEYRGICENHGERLQVLALPFHPLTTLRSDPFTPYTIVAQRGVNGDSACIGGTTGAATCIQNTYADADYNFPHGRIDFHSKRGGLKCTVDDTGMTCGECRYQKHLPLAIDSEQKTYKTVQPEWALGAPSTPQETLQGTFSGFVHQEFRDVYQPMVATLMTYRQPNPSGSGDALVLSFSTNIGFGTSSQPDESVTVKFDPRPLNILSPNPVFDRADHNTDTILKVTRLDSTAIEGLWYSRRFGRVGSFYLLRNGNVAIKDPTKLLEPLSGTYVNEQWMIQMDVGLADNAPISSDPFYPLTIHGRFGLPELTPLQSITNSTYDPFTGMFMITGEISGTIVGQHSKKGIAMKRFMPFLFRPLPTFSNIQLRKSEP